jgi:hypothetical protein
MRPRPFGGALISHGIGFLQSKNFSIVRPGLFPEFSGNDPIIF